MVRLPEPGSDEGEWGQILNDYLSVTHKSDGGLKPNVVTSEVIAPQAIDISNLTPDLQDKVTAIEGALAPLVLLVPRVQLVCKVRPELLEI